MTDTNPTSNGKLYAERDHYALSPHFERHMLALTGEGLERKSAIAAELAHRDARIEQLSGEQQDNWNQFNRLASALGMLGEKTEDIITEATRRLQCSRVETTPHIETPDWRKLPFHPSLIPALRRAESGGDRLCGAAAAALQAMTAPKLVTAAESRETSGFACPSCAGTGCSDCYPTSANVEIAQLRAALRGLMPEGWDDPDGHMDHMPGIRTARLLLSGSSVEPRASQMHVDPSRWFDALGECIGCGKPAHGVVRGDRNQSMGNYCAKCGNARVAKAQKQQDRAQVQHTGTQETK